MRALAVAVAMAIVSLRARAEEPAALHFQATVATQAHPAFHAAYSGKLPLASGAVGNSLRSDAESATSVVMDLFLTLRPWAGAEVLFQPELVGGRGLSSTLGVAAFPSGEVYRVGNPEPTILVGRAALKQAVGPLTLTAGKYSIPDLLRQRPFRERSAQAVHELGAVGVGRLRLPGRRARLHLGPRSGLQQRLVVGSRRDLPRAHGRERRKAR